jgi:hypothetical protein
MNTIRIIVRAFMRLFIDLATFITDLAERGKEHFMDLPLWDRVFLSSTVFLFLSLLFPLVTYRIFGDTQVIRHPHLYVSPILPILAVVATWWEYPQQIWVRLATLVLVLLFAVYVVFPSFVVPETIRDYSFGLGFYLFLVFLLGNIVSGALAIVYER